MVHENENNSASLLIAKKTDLRACTSKPHLYVISACKISHHKTMSHPNIFMRLIKQSQNLLKY